MPLITNVALERPLLQLAAVSPLEGPNPSQGASLS